VFTTHTFDTFVHLYKQLCWLDVDMNRLLRIAYDTTYDETQRNAAKVKSDALAIRIADVENDIERNTRVFKGNIRTVGMAIEGLMSNPGEDE
jgi:hypothetical protein